MRNRVLFSTLAEDLLPRLRKQKGGPLRLLFWGCSLGCEPYTMKFLLGPGSTDEIIGIDQDADAIRQAHLGIYNPGSWTMFFDGQKKLLTESEINQLFEPVPEASPESFQVTKPYRQNVSFLTGDLFSAELTVPIKSFDLVVCNNLLLHLKPDSASLAWDYLYRYLNDDGLLLIGGCNPSVRLKSAKRLNLLPCPEKLVEISKNWCGVSGAWNFNPRPAWAYPEPDGNDPDYQFLAGEIFRKNHEKSEETMKNIFPPAQSPTVRVKNIVISGTNFWNPGDDFVRDGIIRVLRELFPGELLNFLFYNFNADFFPQSKFRGIANFISEGDLEKYRDTVDAVIIVGVPAGDEMKDLYCWIVANGLEEKVCLLGASYENSYVAHYISQEPEATIFRKARIVTGRTAKTPEFIRASGISYHHINCPAILSVREVKKIPAGKTIQRIGFSIQLPHGEGAPNHSCAAEMYELSVELLRELAKDYQVEVIAHHKTEYFHFLELLLDDKIPVIFSSFYHDFFDIYPRYDLVITTRLHASLFANGCGIPGIIINDTDRHTHTLEGFLHSVWVNTRENFDVAFARWAAVDLAAIARESESFKVKLLSRYLEVLRPVLSGERKPAAKISAVSRKSLNPVVLARQVEFGKGVHLQEGATRWLTNRGEMRLPNQHLSGPTNVTFSLTAGDVWCYGKEPLRTLVSLAGKPLRQLVFEKNGQQFEITIRLEPKSEAQLLTIESTASFVPAQIDRNSRDQRQLAVRCSDFTFVEIPETPKVASQLAVTTP
jgi:chemotaxis methyl-accepting protein methylase